MKKKPQKESILARWKQRQRDIVDSNAIPKAPNSKFYPLTRGQMQLFFIEQLYPDNPVYNFSETYTFKGVIDEGKLEQAIQCIVRNQASLRLSFHIVDGKPVQSVQDKLDFQLNRIDLTLLPTEETLSKKEEIMKNDLLKPFHLTKAPLFRATLIKINSEENVLFITMHHIITDKWSMGIFRDQLANYYRADFPESKLKVDLQYTDYAKWQSGQTEDTDQLAYWKTKLSGELPILDLPTDYPIPSQTTFKGASKVVKLSAELSDKILSLAKILGTTNYVLLLAVYYLLLYRYSRQKDILIGSPVTKRNHHSLNDVMGYFDESIVLRCELDPDMCFSDLVQAVKKISMEALSNRDISFDTLVKNFWHQRHLNQNPFFRTMFIYHDVPGNPDFGPDISFDHTFYNFGVSKFDLTLYIAQENGMLTSEFEYSTELFEDPTIDRMHAHLVNLLLGIVTDHRQSLKTIPMLTNAELSILKPREVLKSGPFDDFVAIHHIVEDISKKYPDNIAVSIATKELSYRELNDRSELIANNILNHTGGRKITVGVCLNRSTDLIAGILGILKAGCAYLPIDPEYPKARNLAILLDSNALIVLTQRKFVFDLEEFEGSLVLLEELDNAVYAGSKPALTRNDPAYIIYTSGSTGLPKGVKITHDNIIHSTQARLLYYPSNPSAFLLMSSISFDSSKAGLYWTLCTGGKLVLGEDRIEQDTEKFATLFESQGVTHTLMLPTLYQVLLQYADSKKLQSLETVVVAGEACNTEIVARHFQTIPKVSLYNEYGPTEATVWCSVHQILEADIARDIPIGEAISDMEIYLLDESFDVVPMGSEGEIFIGGPQLSDSYVNNPKLSAQRFIDHPFKEHSNLKLYRSGDLGRLRSDGAIEFRGRVDQQVKIRGYRIELGEIEYALLQIPSVLKTAVTVEKATSLMSLLLQDDYMDTDFMANLISKYCTLDEIAIKMDPDGRNTNNLLPTSYLKNDDSIYNPVDNIKEYLQSKSLEERREIYDQLLNGKYSQPTNQVEIIGYIEVLETLSTENVKFSLHEKLPAYMVPSRIMQINEMPVLPNGKVDQHALLKISLLRTEVEQKTAEKPRNIIEKKLLKIWQDVLNTKDIGIHDNFFEIGGDSIVSIQMISKARESGLELAPNQVFEYQSIAELSSVIKESTADKPMANQPVSGKLSITPIQHWFFDTHFNATHFWNQIFEVDLPKELNEDMLKKVIDEVVQHHDGLRQTFTNIGGIWESHISEFVSDDVFRCRTLVESKNEVLQQEEIDSILEKEQQERQLDQSTLFRAIYFKCYGIQPDKLFLVAHHLLVDMVSWQIIFRYINEGIVQISKGEKLQFRSKTDSLFKWHAYLEGCQKSDELVSEKSFWIEQLRQTSSRGSQLRPSKIYLESEISTISSGIEQSLSAILLKGANEAYNTHPEELILTALLRSFCKWVDTEELRIGLERHGRPMDESLIDLSETVGWFTSFFPLILECQKDSSWNDLVRSTKENIRQIPNGGIGFGIMKYLSPRDEDLAELDFTPQLVFNYLGHSNGQIQDYLTFNLREQGYRDPQSERNYPLEVNVFVRNEIIEFNWSFASTMYTSSKINDLINIFSTHLETLIKHCLSSEQTNYTPSDFTEVDLNQDELNNLINDL